ncbi:SdhA, GRIP coiled-coil protein GCC185 [Legionella wadsworthii]|uniref:SdhA, GRIP coiled-coil protein GCC185 n=1 Tax=Legionella wadsworthii TaxID=28088 RepID=A0A378LU97_9GAMM|nr:hypothetical protein [Legionella wadsworthii]STY30791.1 SdhA, GRIP coiled-coil protein GCC185 [Legionella wadsworthii]
MIFEEYIKLLESFKQNQISKLLERIDTKIFDVLYSKHVSHRIAPYFPRYELCFMSDETELQPGKVYIRAHNGKIAYSVITPDNKIIKDAVLEEIAAPNPFHYKISLITKGMKVEQGVLYVRAVDKGLRYTVLDSTGKLRTGLIKKEELSLPLQPGFKAEDLEPFLPDILSITSKRGHSQPFTLKAFRARVLSATSRLGHTSWAPFKDYSLDPDNISQIKKLINALYYARLTFIDLENVDVRNIKRSYSDLKLLYGKTIDLAYEASYLLTHLDVDLKEMFQEELSIIIPLFNQIQEFVKKQAQNKEEIVKALDPMPIAYEAGEIAGIAVDQMRPIGGDVDFNFLTQFSAVLPSYINRLTQYIEQFSSEIKKSEPKLNQEKLDELQRAALNLLNDIENLKGNSFFVSLKFLNYIHIIRNIITLSTSSLEQIGELSEASQDLIREKLAKLKYEVLPALFSLVDKIEDNAMLKPGTLSVPLMEQVKVLYEKILYLPKKAIDFKAKGEELLEIEDTRFIELRLETTYKRIDKANKKLNRIQKANSACKQFFEILNDPQYKSLSLYQLPADIKKELTLLYKLIKPYMAKLDLNLNDLIISRLTKPEDWSSYVGRPIRYMTRRLPVDHISRILAQEKALKDLITKDENSQLFHIDLNKDLIDSVHKKAKLVLFPFHEEADVYALDESIPLDTEKEKDRNSRLSKAEFQHVKFAYLRFAHIIKEHMEQEPALYEKSLGIHALAPELKSECQQLFLVFQPYLTSIISSEFDDLAQKKVFQPYLTAIIAPEIKNLAISFEHYLSDLFASRPIKSAPSTESFNRLNRNIHTFLDHIDLEWFGKDEFREILVAYNQFSDIIKKQIELKSRRHGHNNFLLTSIDKKAKEECCKLFPIFQPYLKFILPSDLHKSRHRFEKYISALLENESTDILKTPPPSLFLDLDKHIRDFLGKWQDKSQTYYNFSKSKFLDEKDSLELTAKRAEDAKLHFVRSEGDKFLLNTQDLDADQTLEIYQWYRNKHNKFLVIQNAYIQFMKLLSKEMHANPKLQGDILFLNEMDTKVKDRLRNRYSIFQSYLICAVPPELKEDVLQLDKYFAALLSNREVDENAKPSLLLFFELDRPFRDFFSKITNKWRRREQLFNAMAQQKFTQENITRELKPDTRTGREQYVLQHTNYSKRIHEFRQSLFDVTKHLNNTMQKELNPNKPQSQEVIELIPTTVFSDLAQMVRGPSVPYPEMEDKNKRLAQGKQVCALKDIFNSMFHLEGIVLELEKLNDQSAKSRYVYYLLQAYGHLNEIIKSAKRLAADPHLGFIARDLLDKAQYLYATFQEQSETYQMGAEQVSYGPTEVQYNPLWYVLNAFYIGPKHIRALRNTNYLTTEELNNLHIRAKKATLIIENLINDSDSYFKLFLLTPNMIYLYQELTTKLNEFTTTAHDGVIDNLEKIRASVFTPMLLEADRWENRLGLQPGLLSGPLRQITDEFIKGLLHPLGLTSQKYFDIAFDREPLEKRIAQAETQIENSKKYLKRIDESYKDIENLYYWYLQLTTPVEIFDITARPSFVSQAQAKIELAAAYKKALPKLTKLKRDKKIEITPSQYPEDHTLDALCNFGLKDYDPHHTEVEALIVASHHYYLGLKATHQMQLETAGEKLDYLMSLLPIQNQEEILFIDKYTEESFDKNLETMCNSFLGLQYTDAEYRTKLKSYLVKLRTEIIEESKFKEDIDSNIKRCLQLEMSKFEKKYFAQYNHLDAVQIALAHFKSYFKEARTAIDNQTSLFESNETLAEKSNRISKLEAMANDKSLEVQDRIKEISKEINDSNFSRIILKHKQIETFSFAYLKVCLLWLFEALHLYTPSRQQLLEDIKDAVEKPPQKRAATQRIGFFSHPKQAKEISDKDYEPSSMSTATATV